MDTITNFFDNIYDLWMAIPPIIRYPVFFYVQYVLIRRKLASKVEEETDKVSSKFKVYIDRILHGSQPERTAVLNEHYQERALGRGHLKSSVIHCNQGKCSLFG